VQDAGKSRRTSRRISASVTSNGLFLKDIS
jgi:hypothetical protein